MTRRRALFAVADKTGVAEFAREIQALGFEIVSTGGTARALAAAGVDVVPVEQVTGFPEMMDGRVKTLHPNVHGGILARRSDPGHVREMEAAGIVPIDLVCVSFYPFEATVAKEGVTRAEAIEQIDIGGPCMVRAAAKNHEDVFVVTDSSQYGEVLAALRSGEDAREIRGRLAKAAYARTSAYDAAIVSYLERA